MPGNPLTDPNWAPDLADQITDFIGNVRDKTTNNAIKVAARGRVRAARARSSACRRTRAAASSAARRGLQELYDLGTSTGRAVYLSYFTLGGIFTLLGVFLMTKRHPT